METPMLIIQHSHVGDDHHGLKQQNRAKFMVSWPLKPSRSVDHAIFWKKPMAWWKIPVDEVIGSRYMQEVYATTEPLNIPRGYPLELPLPLSGPHVVIKNLMGSSFCREICLILAWKGPHFVQLNSLNLLFPNCERLELTLGTIIWSHYCDFMYLEWLHGRIFPGFC